MIKKGDFVGFRWIEKTLVEKRLKPELLWVENVFSGEYVLFLEKIVIKLNE